MIWIMNWVEIKRGLDSVRSAQRRSATSPDVYTELGSLLADAEALRATGYRALGNELAGRPSPEADIMKLLGSVTLQRVWELARRRRRAAVGQRPGSALRTPGRAGRDHLRRNVGGAAQHHRRAAARAAEGMTTMDYDLGDDAAELRNHLRRADIQPHPRRLPRCLHRRPAGPGHHRDVLQAAGRRGAAGAGLAERAWRRRWFGLAADGAARGNVGPARAPRSAVHGHQLGRPGADALRDSRTEGQAPGGHRLRRRDLVPGLLRAGGRNRPRVAAHPRGAGRRRLAHHRPEGVDVVRADGVLVRAGGLHRSRRAKAQAAHAFSDSDGPARLHRPAASRRCWDRITSTRCSWTTCRRSPATSSARSATAGG